MIAIEGTLYTPGQAVVLVEIAYVAKPVWVGVLLVIILNIGAIILHVGPAVAIAILITDVADLVVVDVALVVGDIATVVYVVIEAVVVGDGARQGPRLPGGFLGPGVGKPVLDGGSVDAGAAAVALTALVIWPVDPFAAKVMVGKTLDDLNLHEQFDVQVVGLLDRSAGDEQPTVLFGSELDAGTTLVAEDTILVYGEGEKLDLVENSVTQL